MPSRNTIRRSTPLSDAITAEQQLQSEFAAANLSSSGISLPSRPALVVDTPNPIALTAEFAYNFFEPNELTAPPGSNGGLAVQSISAERAQFVPRYVKLSWSPINYSNLSSADSLDVVPISIGENRHRLISENDIAISKLYMDYSQQELDFVSNTRSILGRLDSELTALRSANTSELDVKPSLQAAIARLYSSTPDGVDQDFISKYLSYGSSEVMVGQPRLNSPVLNESLETVYQNEDVGVSVTLANTVAGSVLASLYCADPLSDKSSLAAEGIVNAIGFQAALGSARPRFSLSQYGIGDAIADNIVSYQQLDDTIPPGSPMPPMTHWSVGYVVEKRTATPGTTDQPNPTLAISEPELFFVETPSLTELYDAGIAYNQTYYYTVKSVTAFRAFTTDRTTNRNFAVVFLVASEAARTFVQCVDIEPPAPPTDFFISQDSATGKPLLTWNYPVDTRRHVKYFQIFKRKNRGRYRPVQLPFEMIAMYDFNNLNGAQGVVYDKAFDPTYFKFLLPGTENAMAKSSVIDLMTTNSNRNSQVTTTSFLDEEFRAGEYCIYAVVAVDAHGQSSCYSNQIGVSFNRERNTIERTDISPPGAPKTYPNLLVNKDVFLDTIKNEGYSQMTVVLNPDFMQLRNIRGEDLSLVKTQESGGEYVIKLINLDLQKDQTVKFQVLDTRTS